VAGGSPALPTGGDGRHDGRRPGSGRPGPLLIAALVFLVALISSLTTILVAGDDDAGDGGVDATADAPDDDVTDGAPPAEPDPDDDEPDGSEPSTPPSTAAAPVTEEELTAEVAELQEFVEAQREQSFVTDVPVELLDDEAFEQRLMEVMEDELTDIEVTDTLLTTLGLIDPSVDLGEATRTLLGQGVVGFYETEQNELVVRGTGLTPYVRQTIVHELTHALDDQLFELYRPEYDESPEELAAGFAAVIEGNARRVENAWIDSLDEEELAARDREEALYALNADLSGVPDVLLTLLSSPYEDGLIFVDTLATYGGQAQIDAALIEPPTTTEQFLLPEKFLAGEPRLAVEPPTADGELLDEGVFGMQGLRVMLETVILPSNAFQAAEGWAGDWYVLWEEADGSTCIRLDIVNDTAGDAAQLLEALDAYVAEHPAMTVTELDSVTTRIDACVAASGGGGGSRA
jgi:hypothetical protein